MKPLKTFCILILLQWGDLFQGFTLKNLKDDFYQYKYIQLLCSEQDTARYSFCSAQEKSSSLANLIQQTVNSVRVYSCFITCCPFYKISKLRESNYIFHGCLVCDFNIFVKLMFTRSQSTILQLYTASILSQYHWDKAFHFPGKFQFVVKTITDLVRLGVVYRNWVLSTASWVMFCEIYLQSAAHITTIHD